MVRVYDNYPLLQHNTFGMDVKAKTFVEYDSESALQEWIREGGLTAPWLHVGSGSNLLFAKDYEGIVLKSKIAGLEVVAETADWVDVRVGASVVWDNLVAELVERGWYGAENLSLIPGEVGASAVQNIGAYGVEVKDLITVVEGIELETGEKRVFANTDCKYGYRQSIFKSELKGKYAITYVTYRLNKQKVLHLDYGNIRSALSQNTDCVTAKDVRQAIIDIRNQKLPDPKVLGNAGSFFMNPVVSKDKFEELKKDYQNIPSYEVKNGVKIPAGWMIEQCGLKGYHQGRAAVHDKQALVLVNLGGAAPEEIVALAETVQKRVAEKFGVVIKAEVNYV